MQLSVVICTHNPRPDYLRRVLDALKEQSLPKDQWELLLVDNASKEPLAGQWDLSWHPRARHIQEEALGLTPARLRGVREATAEMLVFVDDDNVLSADYLSQALKLAISHTWVGAFGGNVTGEFEIIPEASLENWVGWVGIVAITQEEWAMGPGWSAMRCSPIGAGMVIRKTVAAYYAEVSASHPLRLGLDRKGTSLVSHGDIDMALCACARGLAIGRFPQLRLTHLIPARRLTREYLLNLVEGAGYSEVMLGAIWEQPVSSSNHEPRGRVEKMLRTYRSFRRRLRGQNKMSIHEEFEAARNRGVQKAIQFLKAQSREPT